LLIESDWSFGFDCQSNLPVGRRFYSSGASAGLSPRKRRLLALVCRTGCEGRWRVERQGLAVAAV